MKIIPHLKAAPLFNQLSDSDLMKVMEYIKTKPMVADEVIFKEGDPGDAVYLIADGGVSLQRRNRTGGSATLVELGAREVFGEMALIEDKPRSATAVSQAAGLLLYLEKKDFDMIINVHPYIGVKLMKRLLELICGRLRVTSEVLVNYAGG